MAPKKPAVRPDIILSLVDVYGEPIKEDADVLLRHSVTQAVTRLTVPAGRTASLNGLSKGPIEQYLIDLDPPSYLRAAIFVAARQGDGQEITVRCVLDPTKVNPTFPSFNDLSPDVRRILDASTDVLGGHGLTGASLFDALDPVQKAGFLNVVTKASRTGLANQRTIASYLDCVYEIRGDRSFFEVDKDLRERIKDSAALGYFRRVNDSLHHPPTGFTSAGSWKTPDRYGNLQVTCWANDKGDWRADIDVDDAAGLEHVFQVVHNSVTGLTTNPYVIHQLLLSFQKMPAPYRLEPIVANPV